jgi:hypothetical protein
MRRRGHPADISGGVRMKEAKFQTGTYEGELRWILCLVCGHKSFNQEDVERRYCGYCHEFYEEEDEARE